MSDTIRTGNKRRKRVPAVEETFELFELVWEDLKPGFESDHHDDDNQQEEEEGEDRAPYPERDKLDEDHFISLVCMSMESKWLRYVRVTRKEYAAEFGPGSAFFAKLRMAWNVYQRRLALSLDQAVVECSRALQRVEAARGKKRAQRVPARRSPSPGRSSTNRKL